MRSQSFESNSTLGPLPVKYPVFVSRNSSRNSDKKNKVETIFGSILKPCVEAGDLKLYLLVLLNWCDTFEEMEDDDEVSAEIFLV